MKCPKCQHENPESTKFCGECGTQLTPPVDAQPLVTETLETSREDLATGSVFAGRYQVIEELGKGGMGKVYKVLDKEIHTKIALKLIKPEIAADQKTIERFRNELKTARDISHKNVCRMYDIGKERDSYFITMEYIEGQDLKGLIRQSGQLAVATSISIASQICEGLDEAHKKGIIHRDLKPSNIMIDKQGNARIMDFGIARAIKGKGITGAGVMIGTPEYMSPEQVEGKDVDSRSDLYSVGIIIYEMLTSRVPFEGDTPFTVGVKHKSEAPEDPKIFNSSITDDLNQIILKCLEKKPEDRFQTTGEICSELTRIEQGLPTTEKAELKKKPTTAKHITVSISPKKFLIPALAILIVVTIGLVIIKPWKKIDSVPIAPEEISIAVLPFDDLSAEKDQDIFCVGLAESLITALSHIRELRIPSITSSSLVKIEKNSIQEIGNRLNVRSVLRGSVHILKEEKRVRIWAQLLNTNDETLIWSDQYDVELRDIFSVQDQICLAIVNELRVNLLEPEKMSLVKRYTENVEAYDLYLKGRYFWNLRTEDGLKKAIEYFHQAIEIDPAYALSYSGLADSYVMLSDYGYVSTNENRQKAKEAIQKALEIDDSLAEAYASSASVKRNFDWDINGARKDYERAIQLNPNYGTAHQWYANCLSVLGLHKEAVAEAKKARDLDPLSPIINRNVGRRLYFAGDYNDSIEESLNAMKIAPGFFPVLNTLGKAYIQKGMLVEAVETLNRAVDLTGGHVYAIANLGYAYAVMGNKKQAQKILNELIEKSKHEYVPFMAIAQIYVGLGDFDQAIIYLEKAFDDRAVRFMLLKIDPIFNSLRADSRVRSLLKKAGLE